MMRQNNKNSLADLMRLDAGYIAKMESDIVSLQERVEEAKKVMGNIDELDREKYNCLKDHILKTLRKTADLIENDDIVGAYKFGCNYDYQEDEEDGFLSDFDIEFGYESGYHNSFGDILNLLMGLKIEMQKRQE